MPQISVEIPESAPQEFDPEAQTQTQSSSSSPNKKKEEEETKTNDNSNNNNNNRTKIPRKSSMKSPTKASTAVSESQHGSQNSWNSPFRTISKSLIGFFITVLVIARIRSKPSGQQQSHDTDNNSNPMPSALKRKKTVRILDMSGNLVVPSKNNNNKNGTTTNSQGGLDTPDTTAAASNDFHQDSDIKRMDQLDDNSEWKHVYKPLFCKVFVIALLGALGVVLWAVLS